MNTLKPEEKKGLIAEWKMSGKSAIKFCSEKGIKPTTFYGWIKKEKKNRSSKFIEISKKPLSIKTDGIIIIEKGDVKIHIPIELEKSVLVKIFKALEI